MRYAFECELWDDDVSTGSSRILLRHRFDTKDGANMARWRVRSQAQITYRNRFVEVRVVEVSS